MRIDQFAILDYEINRINSHNLEILDIGAGPGTVWARPNIRKLSASKRIEVTTFDANESIVPLSNDESLIKLKILGRAPADLLQIPDNSFDLVIAYDLIEHLPKHEGYKLLYQINRIARHTSIIFTPNGFLWQPPSVNNEFNQHISGWTPSDLRQMGWKRIRGHTGLRINFGPYGLAKANLLPIFLRKEIYALGTIIVFLIPRLAFSFSAVQRQKRVGIDYQE
jgi:ubiquinone/menaquinone biosynthesis C-methylase UbiE